MAAIHGDGIALALVLVAAVRKRRATRRRKATLPYVLKREIYGAFHSLVQEMAVEDPKQLRNFLRLSGETFDELLHTVGGYITKQNTSYKDSIPPEERLAVTLRYLAQGGPYVNMFYLFRIPVSTLAYLIPDTCAAIYNALREDHLKFPNSEAEWSLIQEQFFRKWNFPQCLGALDGKHVQIQCPQNSGSLYFNYLRFYSVVLFALVDANYCFLYYEVGAAGRTGDATIWNASQLKEHLDNESLCTPPPLAAPNTNTLVPSLIVADSAFALGAKLMKPYPEKNITPGQKIFNYRLSRARRVVENAFGILASRFGVYQYAMKINPQTVKSVVQCTVALHNFLRHKNDQIYCGPGTVDAERGEDHEVIPGAWRNNRHAHLPSLQPPAGGLRDLRNVHNGREVREALKNYFLGPGAVPWQSQHV